MRVMHTGHVFVSSFGKGTTWHLGERAKKATWRQGAGHGRWHQAHARIRQECRCSDRRIAGLPMRLPQEDAVSTTKRKPAKRPPLRVGDVLEVPIRMRVERVSADLVNLSSRLGPITLLVKRARTYRRLPKKGGRR